MKFLEQQVLYNNNIYSKFQGQKIHPKKDTQNLPTSVTRRNNFKAANFNILPRAVFFINYENFGIRRSLC